MASFTVKIGGREVTFKSEDDFARAMAAMDRVERPQEKGGKATRSGVATGNAYDALQAAQEFLHELVNHPQGIHSTVVSQALKCEPRGIGRRLLEVDAILKGLGLKRDNVYDNAKRLAEGGRLYFPKQDASAAWEAIKRKTGSG